MKLGPLERFYVNSLFRSRVQRPLEFALFQRIAPIPTHAHILEIGCGNGGGLRYLDAHHAPASLTGIDLDPAQIALAKRLQKHLKAPLTLQVASAEAIPLPAQAFDLVLSAGCLHHVPNWQAAVVEVARLLHSGGLFYVLEFYQPLLTAPLMHSLLPHPPQRFTRAELTAELTRHGFEILGTLPAKPTRFKNSLGNLASLMVARRTLTVPEYD